MSSTRPTLSSTRPTLVAAVLAVALSLAAPTGAQTPLESPLASGALTMEEAASITPPRAATPQEALNLLVRGNVRFYSGQAERPELDAFQRRAQVVQQSPFAVVLGCSDSRVPLEIVFDQGLGDLFAVRVAGNVVEPGTAGSVEYAVEHLRSHLVVVMGHEGCGAVKAALLPLADQEREPESVRFLLERIRPAVAELPDISDPKARMREAVILNVRRQMREMAANPTVAAAVDQGRLAVVGAYYELSSGAVDFILPDGERMGSVLMSDLPAGFAGHLRSLADAHDETD